jgi:nucleotide-binding universal stress UspA family protein
MFKKILVPVDGSQYSARAVERAADVAGRYGATVTLLFAPELQSLRDAPVADARRASPATRGTGWR